MNRDPIPVHQIFGVLIVAFAIVMLLREIDVFRRPWADYLPGVGHSWIGATPDETRRASLAALDRTFRFIEALARPDH